MRLYFHHLTAPIPHSIAQTIPSSSSRTPEWIGILIGLLAVGIGLRFARRLVCRMLRLTFGVILLGLAAWFIPRMPGHFWLHAQWPIAPWHPILVSITSLLRSHGIPRFR